MGKFELEHSRRTKRDAQKDAKHIKEHFRKKGRKVHTRVRKLKKRKGYGVYVD